MGKHRWRSSGFLITTGVVGYGCCDGISPVRYAKFESIRYFIDIDILTNCLIDIDIFQNHHIDIDSDIDIFGIALLISI